MTSRGDKKHITHPKNDDAFAGFLERMTVGDGELSSFSSCKRDFLIELDLQRLPVETSVKPYHEIKRLYFSGEYMVVTVDENEKRFRIRDISSTLQKASEAERNTYEISPSGYGIHWPLIDEDLSVDALLGIAHTRDTKRKSA